MSNTSSPSQPFLPRISLRTLFGLVTACAPIVLAAQIAGQGNAFLLALLLVSLWLVSLAAVSAILFCVAYTIGSLKDVYLPETVTKSPFATDAKPPQQVDPQQINAN